jgi:hypothetical protein
MPCLDTRNLGQDGSWSKVSFPSEVPRWETGRFVKKRQRVDLPCRWVRCELLPLRRFLFDHLGRGVKLGSRGGGLHGNAASGSPP